MYKLLRQRRIFSVSSVQQSSQLIFSCNNCKYFSGRSSSQSAPNHDNRNTEDLSSEEAEITNDRNEYQHVSKYETGGSSSSWMDKLVYSSYLEKFMPPKGYKERLKERFEMREMQKQELVGKTVIMPPVSLKYLLNDNQAVEDEDNQRKNTSQQQEDNEENTSSVVQFPYRFFKKTEFVEDSEFKSSDVMSSETGNEVPNPVKLESMADRLRKGEIDPESLLNESVEDLFDQATEMCIEDAGTPNPNVPPSNIPCGGCGALLHCQDQSIPGYMSSERFKRAKKADLMAEVCYRCSVLETHQATLNVNVSSEDYPKIVSKIREQFAMVLLIVDLTDFPCSIWPGILDIIGSRRPIFLVGNKVDLLPQDSPDYLRRVEDSLIKCAVDIGMLEANIIHTALVSAKTGYGVENLISSIFNLIKGKGDIFIMGCTNVGKSSLFNIFLQSDLCKPKASDLVQKATISQWPGTTLNLLKFPMSMPTGWRNFLRQRRLNAEGPMLRKEEQEREIQLKITGNFEHSILQGHVGKTFISQQKQDAIDSAVTVKDIFHVNSRTKVPPQSHRLGQWDPNDPDFRGFWVYDTPGAVNNNQILDLLTLPELVQSLPKELIQPRSFFIKPNMSFFIGGVARLDFLEGPKPIRYTLFSNSSLPVTMSLLDDAEEVYKKAFGSKVFGVPCGNDERLSQFPPLQGETVEFEGNGHDFSCADIVLSSIGWVAVSAGHNQKFRLAVHTPNGKGIFVRRPALLPYAVNWKGKRIRGTYTYMPHKLYCGPKKVRQNRPRF